MNLRAPIVLEASPRLVILRASDKDARRISTYSSVSEFTALQRSRWEGNP